MRPYERLAQFLETSEEILVAIAEVVGDETTALFVEWDVPTQRTAHDYVRRATAISPGRSMFWGLRGCVHDAGEYQGERLAGVDFRMPITSFK